MKVADDLAILTSRVMWAIDEQWLRRLVSSMPGNSPVVIWRIR